MVDSKQQWKAWLYLAPAIVLLLVFTVWPIFNTVRMAFLENYSGLKAAAGMQFEFGIGNFLLGLLQLDKSLVVLLAGVAQLAGGIFHFCPALIELLLNCGQRFRFVGQFFLRSADLCQTGIDLRHARLMLFG